MRPAHRDGPAAGAPLVEATSAGDTLAGTSRLPRPPGSAALPRSIRRPRSAPTHPGPRPDHQR